MNEGKGSFTQMRYYPNFFRHFSANLSHRMSEERMRVFFYTCEKFLSEIFQLIKSFSMVNFIFSSVQILKQGCSASVSRKTISLRQNSLAFIRKVVFTRARMTNEEWGWAFVRIFGTTETFSLENSRFYHPITQLDDDSWSYHLSTRVILSFALPERTKVSS